MRLPYFPPQTLLSPRLKKSFSTLTPSLIALSLCTFITGCSQLTRHEYVQPELNLPKAWSHAQEGRPTNSQAPSLKPWWAAFNDPELNQLIQRVLHNNNDLKAAGLAVRKAWLTAGIDTENTRPQLSATFESDASQPLKGNHRSTTHSHSLSLGVSYEIDLWGKLASTEDAAKWEARATESDEHNTAWTLSATTAKLYWQLAYQNEHIQLITENINDATQSLKLTSIRHKAGAVSGLDEIEAEQTLVSLKTSLAQLAQERIETRNALAILLGEPTDASANLPTPSALALVALPTIQAGLPASLLANRPDLQAAEKRLKSTLASGDASRLSYYPALSLTGNIGHSSSALKNLLSNPIATLGAGITLPFLQYHEMQLTSALAKADYDQAVIQFKQTLYEALADVENALSADNMYSAQTTLYQRNYDLALAAEKRYTSQYRAGAITAKDWLSAQTTRRNSAVTLLENKFNAITSRITLIQALGGSLKY